MSSYYLVLSDEAWEYAEGGLVIFGAGVAGAGFGEQDGPDAVLKEANGAG